MKRLFFDSDKAWGFLSAHDYVFTLRHHPGKRDPPVVEPVGIWRHKKPTKFVGRKVPVWFFNILGEWDKTWQEALKGYDEHSGFGSPEEWWAEAQRLSGPSPNGGWVIYYVEVATS